MNFALNYIPTYLTTDHAARHSAALPCLISILIFSSPSPFSRKPTPNSQENREKARSETPGLVRTPYYCQFGARDLHTLFTSTSSSLYKALSSSYEPIFSIIYDHSTYLSHFNMSDDELDREWKPSGKARPQSTMARSFSLALNDLFKIDNSIADLDAAVSEKYVPHLLRRPTSDSFSQETSSLRPNL